MIRLRNLYWRFSASVVALSLVFSQMPGNALASNHLDPLMDSGNATVDRTSVPGETILIYSTTGTSTFAAPHGATSVRVLVVAGGGAGGSDNAGGGGAGGLIEDTDFSVTPGSALTVTVGAGGVAPTGVGKGGNGSNSVFGSLTAIGGGGGGFHNNRNGNNGGSGGGAGGTAAGTGGTGTVGQGNAGGSKGATAHGRTSGGGGAGAAGTNGAAAPGAGGVGLSSNITGSATFYAGGGGGAGRNDAGNVTVGAPGGNGGGGQGAGSNGVSTDGTANTGGGGGGGSCCLNGITPGGDGGSGIVIVRFTTQSMAITTTSLPDGTTSPVTYSRTLQVIGGTAPHTWSITVGTLPDGLSLNSTTGEISGEATSEGTSTFTVQVEDDEGHIDTQALSIKIVIPVVTTLSLSSGAVSVPYSQTLAAAGGTPPYTWSITSGSLPDGLSLNAGTGEITGTPTTEGTSNFTIQTEDDLGGVDDQILSIIITAEPVITTTSLSDGTLNSAYVQTLAVAGGAIPFTWSVSAGTLPDGLSLNAGTGEITGTPTVTGTSNFTVEVEDDHSLTDTQALSITVNDVPVITTASLPGGTEENSYSQTLQVLNGTTPFTWSVTVGTLPPGLSLDASTGEISGIPTTGGISTFTIQVSDANGATDTQDLSINIAEKPQRSSGSTVQSRVKNLTDMGNTEAANALKNKWSHLFSDNSSVPSSPPTIPSSSSCSPYTFTRNLRLGDEGEDVRALQKFLNCLGFTLANDGPGSPGQETTLFRTLTHNAVVRFQEYYTADILTPLNLTKGTGLFYELSRAKVNALLGGDANQ